MWPVLIAVYTVSATHVFIGMLSVCIGFATTMSAEVWLAHRVSPMLCGGFFLLTGVMGVICARKKTVYLIMCWGAFSLVSMVTAVVNIQLLRRGLVNHMSDGDTLKKDVYDVEVLIALGTAGAEILVCLISAILSCRFAYRAKQDIHKKNEGTFSVQILGQKNIVINITKKTPSYDKLSEQGTDSSTDASQSQCGPLSERSKEEEPQPHHSMLKSETASCPSLMKTNPL